MPKEVFCQAGLSIPTEAVVAQGSQVLLFVFRAFGQLLLNILPARFLACATLGEAACASGMKFEGSCWCRSELWHGLGRGETRSFPQAFMLPSLLG